MQHIGYMSGSAKCFIYGSALYHGMPCSGIVAIILQNEKPQRRSNTLNLRTHGSSTNSLILMRRYEVTDFPGLTIFYKMKSLIVLDDQIP